jgi:hypothetical protein
MPNPMAQCFPNGDPMAPKGTKLLFDDMGDPLFEALEKLPRAKMPVIDKSTVGPVSAVSPAGFSVSGSAALVEELE